MQLLKLAQRKTEDISAKLSIWHTYTQGDITNISRHRTIHYTYTYKYVNIYTYIHVHFILWWTKRKPQRVVVQLRTTTATATNATTSASSSPSSHYYYQYYCCGGLKTTYNNFHVLLLLHTSYHQSTITYDYYYLIRRLPLSTSTNTYDYYLRLLRTIINSQVRPLIFMRTTLTLLSKHLGLSREAPSPRSASAGDAKRKQFVRMWHVLPRPRRPSFSCWAIDMNATFAINCTFLGHTCCTQQNWTTFNNTIIFGFTIRWCCECSCCWHSIHHMSTLLHLWIFLFWCSLHDRCLLSSLEKLRLFW